MPTYLPPLSFSREKKYPPLLGNLRLAPVQNYYNLNHVFDFLIKQNPLYYGTTPWHKINRYKS